MTDDTLALYRELIERADRGYPSAYHVVGGDLTFARLVADLLEAVGFGPPFVYKVAGARRALLDHIADNLGRDRAFLDHIRDNLGRTQ